MGKASQKGSKMENESTSKEQDSQENIVSGPDILYGNASVKVSNDSDESTEVKSKESEDEKSVVDKNDAEKTPDDKVEAKKKPKQKKSKFVFDKKKYIDQGIENEDTLKILEEKDRDLHSRNVTIGNLGHEKKASKDRIESITKELESLKDKTKDLEQEDYDDLSNSQIKELEESRQEEQKLLREKQMLQNQSILSQFKNEYDDIDVNDVVDNIELIIRDDLSEFGRDDKEIDAVVSEFKKDPMGYFEPGYFHNFIRRVTLSTETDALKEENKSLKDTIEKLNTDLRGKSSEVLENIKKVKNSPHAIDSIPGGYSSSPTSKPKTGAQIMYGT